MISLAAVASLAKWTLPPTASRRSVNCSTSSGRRSRLARRRCLRSARPVAKSKLLNPASRRLRKPVIAWIRAPCSLGSSRALLTRRPKWRLDSGTRLDGFSDRLADRCCFRHRRSEEHTSELQSHLNLVCRLLLEKKKNILIVLTEYRYNTRCRVV